MSHLFLSPHPDDAVLSCGGIIHALAQRGEAVEVLTLMAGDAPPLLPQTSIIEEVHARWGLGSNPFPARRDEDREAVESLGAHVIFWKWKDDIYRTDPSGNPLYPDVDAIFGAIHPHDPLPNDELPLGDDFTALYIPLGVGHHVDHQIVRNLAIQWLQSYAPDNLQVFFYEEYPYSANGFQVIELALQALPFAVEPVIYGLNETNMMAKVNAISRYESQISSFWDHLDHMAQEVYAYAQQVGSSGYAERLWQIK